METTKSKQFIVKNMRADPKLVPLIINKAGNSNNDGIKLNSLQASLTSFKFESGKEQINAKLLIEKPLKADATVGGANNLLQRNPSS